MADRFDALRRLEDQPTSSARTSKIRPTGTATRRPASTVKVQEDPFAALRDIEDEEPGRGGIVRQLAENIPKGFIRGAQFTGQVLTSLGNFGGGTFDPSEVTSALQRPDIAIGKLGEAAIEAVPDIAREPENFFEEAGALAGEELGAALFGGITTAGWLSLAKSGAVTMGPLLRNIAEHPVKFAIADTVAASSSGASRAVAREVAPDQPMIELGAGLVGSIAPSAGTGALLTLINKAESSRISRVAKDAFDLVRPTTAEGARIRAGKMLVANAADAERTAQRLASSVEFADSIPGFRPSVAGASGDIGIQSLTQRVASKSSRLTQGLIEDREQNRRAIAALDKQLRPDGDPAFAAGWIAQRQQILRDELAREVDDAVENTSRRVSQFTQGVTESTASKRLPEILEEEFQRLQATFHGPDGHWQSLTRMADELGVKVDVTDVLDEIRRQKGEFSRGLRGGKAPAETFRTLTNRLTKEEPTQMPFGVAMAKMRELNVELDELSKAVQSGVPGATTRRKHVADLKRSLTRSFDRFEAESEHRTVAETYRVLNQSWREMMESYRDGVLGKQLGNFTQDDKIQPIMESFFVSGTKGDLNMREFGEGMASLTAPRLVRVGDTMKSTTETGTAAQSEANRLMKSYVIGKAVRENSAPNRSNVDVINEESLRKWVSAHDPAISAIDELAPNLGLREALDETEGMGRVVSDLIARGKRITDPSVANRSAARAFLKAYYGERGQDPRAAFDAIFHGRTENVQRNVRDLMRAAEGNEQAIDGIRAMFWDEMSHDITTLGRTDQPASEIMTWSDPARLDEKLDIYAAPIRELFGRGHHERLKKMAAAARIAEDVRLPTSVEEQTLSRLETALQRTGWRFVLNRIWSWTVKAVRAVDELSRVVNNLRDEDVQKVMDAALRDPKMSALLMEQASNPKQAKRIADRLRDQIALHSNVPTMPGRVGERKEEE